MELGNFLGKLKGEKKSEPKKFLALVLTDEVVQAAVWSIVEEKTEILAIGTPVEWDGDTGTTSELIIAVDATISNACEGLEDEPSSVILGIPNTWTNKDGVLGVKRDFIAKIRKELDLEVLGYVPITESIISYLKLQEGTPSTSILIQVSRDELSISLVRLGRIETTEVIGRSDDVVEDVTEGIARFKIMDNLPSRIILFNSMHSLDEIIQNLLSIDWPGSFNFLHIPKIEALPKDVTIRALSVAGGSEVARSMGLAVVDSIPEADQPVVTGPVSPSPDEPVEDLRDPEFLTADEIGFTISLNIDPLPKAEPVDPPFEQKISQKPRFTMPKIKLSLPKLAIPKFQLNLGGIKRHVWLSIGVILASAALLFYLVWSLPKASVSVSVLPHALDQSVDLTLSTTSPSINFTDKIVPAIVDTISETGEKIVETTGKKTVGDPAKGEVTIYNRTSASKNFAKGTTITASSLKFTLDQDVTVASKSAGSDYVDVPGKASVSITAASIGTDSNLGSLTEFTIASFGKDSYVAKNDNAFAGGTSEEVQVVAKDDQKILVESLTKELLETLSSQAKSSSDPGTGVYLMSDSVKVDEVIYSAKIGEPAKSLSANLTITAVLLKYQTSDVTTLVNSAIDTAVPSGYVRANLPSTVDLSASVVSDDKTTVSGTAQVKVQLLPLFDKLSLQKSLKGRAPLSVSSIIKNAIPGFLSAELQITPKWIPTRLKLLPLNSKNISIQIIPVL